MQVLANFVHHNGAYFGNVKARRMITISPAVGGAGGVVVGMVSSGCAARGSCFGSGCCCCCCCLRFALRAGAVGGTGLDGVGVAF